MVDQINGEDGQAVAIPLDLADRKSIESAVAGVADRFGRLDVLIANAIRWPMEAEGPLADVDPGTWEHAVRVNLEGTVPTVRAAMTHLARSDADRIVIISSTSSRDGGSGDTAYATAKAGLDGLVAALKWEAGSANVLVNIVSPGLTVTENVLAYFSDELRESYRQRTPSTHLSVPNDIASVVVFLGSPANGNITGSYLPVAGGFD